MAQHHLGIKKQSKKFMVFVTNTYKPLELLNKNASNSSTLALVAKDKKATKSYETKEYFIGNFSTRWSGFTLHRRFKTIDRT